MEQYTYWLITGIIGLMIGALGWFIKRTVSDLEAKITRTETTNQGRFESIEKRIEKQEERFDRMIKDLPKTYAYRDDLIRMTQNIDGRLDKIQDTLMELKRGT